MGRQGGAIRYNQEHINVHYGAIRNNKKSPEVNQSGPLIMCVVVNLKLTSPLFKFHLRQTVHNLHRLDALINDT